MVDIIPFSKGKRNWSDDFKERVLAEAEEPGKSIKSVANRYGLDKSQLYQWRKKFRSDRAKCKSMTGSADTAGSTEFLPVEIIGDGEITPTNATAPEPCAQIMFPNGRQLTISATLDRVLLERVIAAVASS